jgi:aryl-alcohol dehydrogenase-like predicted oxidoreductase
MPIVDILRRELGRTGLHVTMLGYGAMELRGAPRGRDVTEAQAETILNAALDAGINYLDTSIDYGLSEERIGRYEAHRRAEYYLASKCGCVVGADPAPRGQRTSQLDGEAQDLAFCAVNKVPAIGPSESDAVVDGKVLTHYM